MTEIEVSFEGIYSPGATEIIDKLLSELSVQHFTFRPQGNYWFLSKYEFDAHVRGFNQEELEGGEVSVQAAFNVVPGTYVDSTDYGLYAKILRFLWGLRYYSQVIKNTWKRLMRWLRTIVKPRHDPIIWKIISPFPKKRG